MKLIEIAGKSYELCFKIYTVSLWEERTKKNVFEMQTTLAYTDLMMVFWCALLAKQPKMTVEKAADIMEAYLEEGHDIADLWGILQECLADAGFMKGQAKRYEQRAEAAKAEALKAPEEPALEP